MSGSYGSLSSLPEDVACSSEMAIVLVDDATGEPRLCESP